MFSRTLSLFAALAYACTALASGVIVPLYIDPGKASTCKAWQPLLDAISANPSVSFYLIINPDSGPGSSGSQPDSSYQSCIPKLTQASLNVVAVGYVATGYGDTSQSTVMKQVATYAGWGSAYRPRGIFFDEVDPTSDLLSLYTTYAQNVRSSFDNSFVILNPGSDVGTTGYYNIADQIVTFEDYYSNFEASDLTVNSNNPASKQSVIIHDAPSSPPSSVISQLVGSDGIGSLYITDDTESDGGNPYDSLPSEFSTFVALVAADS